MGLGGISPFQLIIILVIVLLLFGGKRLRTLGSDLGSAIKGFRKSMDDPDQKAAKPEELEKPQASTQEAQKTSDKSHQ